MLFVDIFVGRIRRKEIAMVHVGLPLLLLQGDDFVDEIGLSGNPSIGFFQIRSQAAFTISLVISKVIVGVEIVIIVAATSVEGIAEDVPKSGHVLGFVDCCQSL